MTNNINTVSNHQPDHVDSETLEEAMKITLDRWPDLTSDGKVSTKEFLQCSNIVVKFIDSLGLAFTPVSRDVHGNIKKLMAKYLEEPERYRYIQDLISDEINSRHKTATDALLWLKRGLNFLCTLLQLIVQDHEKSCGSENLTGNLRSSYEATLAMYHGFLMRQLFNILCQASPSRTQLMQRLSIIVNNPDPDSSIAELKVFYQGLRANLDALFAFYETLPQPPPPTGQNHS